MRHFRDLPDAARGYTFTPTMFGISSQTLTSVDVSTLPPVRPWMLYTISGSRFASFGDGFEVLVEAFGRGLVVIRRHGENAIGSGALRILWRVR